jgi:hypothetical protein
MMEADTGRVVWRRKRHDRRVQSSCLLRMQVCGPPVTRTQQRFCFYFLAILCYKKKQNGDDSWEAVGFSRFFGWRNSIFLAKFKKKKIS